MHSLSDLLFRAIKVNPKLASPTAYENDALPGDANDLGILGGRMRSLPILNKQQSGNNIPTSARGDGPKI